eukprot:7507070-Alexandrium_andersonii.AAC.1
MATVHSFTHAVCQCLVQCTCMHVYAYVYNGCWPASRCGQSGTQGRQAGKQASKQGIIWEGNFDWRAHELMHAWVHV